MEDLWEGREWRRSREMELRALELCWVRGAWVDADYDKILATMLSCGYDDERSRQTGWDLSRELKEEE